MSYILDALRESQTCRELTETTTGGDAASTGRARHTGEPFLKRYLAPSCLAVGALIVSYLVLQPAPFAGDTGRSAKSLGERAAPPSPDPAMSQVATAGVETPSPTGVVAGREIVAASAGSVINPPTVPPARPVEPIDMPMTALQPAPGKPANIPTLAELSASYRGTLPALNVEVHVYDTRPARRFVIINQHRYREGQRIADGPLVEEITHEGVVMVHAGRRFRLML